MLRRAEELFDAFITADQNLRFQQQLTGRKLAILLLPSNQVPVVTQLVTVVESLLMTVNQAPLSVFPLTSRDVYSDYNRKSAIIGVEAQCAH